MEIKVEKGDWWWLVVVVLWAAAFLITLIDNHRLIRALRESINGGCSSVLVEPGPVLPRSLSKVIHSPPFQT